MPVTYTKEAVADAKANGLHLVKLEINGKHAKRSSMSFAGTMGPETARKCMELFTLLCGVKTRMK